MKTEALGLSLAFCFLGVAMCFADDPFFDFSATPVLPTSLSFADSAFVVAKAIACSSNPLGDMEKD